MQKRFKKKMQKKFKTNAKKCKKCVKKCKKMQKKMQKKCKKKCKKNAKKCKKMQKIQENANARKLSNPKPKINPVPLILFDHLYILFLQEDTTYLSFLAYPKYKEQKDLTLAKLEASTNTIFVHVKDYVDADWAFVEALSRAKDLVTFLKQVLNEGV